jgi:hypothetical protein
MIPCAAPAFPAGEFFSFFIHCPVKAFKTAQLDEATE